MQNRHTMPSAALAVALMSLSIAPVWAQSAETEAAPAKGGWMSSFLSKIGLSAPSMNSVSPSNIAGALQYCLQKQDVSPKAATTESALVSQTESSGKASPAEFQAGEKGTLEGSSGKTLQLDSASISKAIKDKACNAILQRAQAILG